MMRTEQPANFDNAKKMRDHMCDPFNFDYIEDDKVLLNSLAAA